MAKYKVEDIRNIALCGHGSAGKTTLVDTILNKTGAVNRQGSVDDGTSICDFDDEEKAHKYSIEASVVNFEHGGKHFNVIDTPGYPDLVGQAEHHRGHRLVRRDSSKVIVHSRSPAPGGDPPRSRPGPELDPGRDRGQTLCPGEKSPLALAPETVTGTSSLTDFELYVPGLLSLSLMMLMFTAAGALKRKVWFDLFGVDAVFAITSIMYA